MSYLNLKYPWSKWKKHKVLWEDTELQPYLPETAPLDASALHVFMRKYPVVFAKPSRGGGGRGVIKLSRELDVVTIWTTTNRYTVSLEGAYRKVRQLAGEKHYIIQQGVDLIGVSGRPMDFRALLLKPDSEWSFMGIMGKQAVREQIVTNHCRGGSSVTFQEALKNAKELEDEEIERLEKEMESLSQRIAETLSKRFYLISELGLDIGIDQDLKLWLIEANTRPQYNLFKDHPDKTLYKRIDGMITKLRVPLTQRRRRSG